MRLRPGRDARRLIPALLATTLVALTAPQSSAQEVPPAPLVAQHLPTPAQPASKRPAPEWDSSSVLVKFKSTTTGAGRESSMGRHGATEDGAAGATGYVVARLDGADPKQALRDFEADPDVQDAELNYLRHASATPNDPGFTEGFQEYLKTIRSPAAWDQTKGATAKMIAILDTGIDTDHPDLVTRIRAGYNALTGGTNVVDDNGHGTFVAGIAGAITNNFRGIAGSAWFAGLQPIKVLNAEGAGTDADIAEGITWAADHGASVLNLSLGGYGASAVLQDAVNYALSKDKVVVAAAGNDFGPFASLPAAYPGVIAVTATDNSSTFAFFSNYGNWVDVAAPGTAITSTFPGSTELYATGAGTSFAAPLVAGVALLVRVKYPTWKQATVHNRIRDTARDFGPRGFDPFYGKGRLDAFAALGGAKLAPAAQPLGDAWELNPTPDRAKAMTGSSVSGSISPEGDVDWFYKDVTATGSVTFTLTPPAYDPDVFRTREMDPVLEVYGPDLALLGTQDAGFLGTAETLKVPAATTGHYFARVSNFGGSRTPSNYTLSVLTSLDPWPTPFAPNENLPMGNTNEEATAIADVTGDGLLDVIAVTAAYNDPANDDKVMVFPSLADGTRGPVQKYSRSVANYGAGNFDVGDLSGDGKTDVAVPTSGGIDVFTQSGSGLTGPTLVPTTADPDQIDVIDLDGDADQDMVFAESFFTGGIHVLTHAGSTYTATKVSTEVANEVEVGDVTSDGRPDIVLVRAGVVKVLAQTPAGTFAAPVTYTYPNGAFGGGLALADVTGDGRTDAISSEMANSPNAKVFVWPQTAAGALSGPVTYASLDSPGAVEAADINGDGRGDVVTGNGGWGSLQVYLQRGDGALAPPTTLSLNAGNGSARNALSIGDFSGDGRPDLAYTGPFDGLNLLRQLPPAAPGPLVWVRDQTPADFSLNISTTISPKVEFARGIQTSSITTATVQLLNANSLLPIAATRTYDAATKTITINPTPTLGKDVPFLVRVNGVKDLAGNILAPLYSFRFKTAA
jgi:subtilisin family serine protease